MTRGRTAAAATPDHPLRSPGTVAVVCLDAPESQAARTAATPAHLRWVESMLDHIAVAGPLYSEDGARMIGSLYVFKTASLVEARSWLESDPFFMAGFWADVQLRPFLPAAGELVGGKIW